MDWTSRARARKFYWSWPRPTCGQSRIRWGFTKRHRSRVFNLKAQINVASSTNILTVFNGSINKNSFTIPIKINEKNVKTETLIDSGAGGKFIDQNYARTLALPLQNLTKPTPALNVDGTLNKKGTIKHYVNLDLDIFGQKQTMHLLVTGLGKQKIILGFPWLQKHNPIINWQTRTFEWQHIPQKINFRKHIENLLVEPLPKPTVTKEEDPEEWMTWTVNILGTDCQDALISPLIKIQEQIMDEGA